MQLVRFGFDSMPELRYCCFSQMGIDSVRSKEKSKCYSHSLDVSTRTIFKLSAAPRRTPTHVQYPSSLDSLLHTRLSTWPEKAG